MAGADEAPFPKDGGAVHSSLSSMWKWAKRRDLTVGTSPWTGLTAGLKRKSERLARVNGRERPYSADELVKLLKADPSAGRRWSYSAAIFDTLRIALLTGARQNEICSLRRCDIVREGTAMKVDEAVAKTGNSIREIPLHALAQKIIQARLAELAKDGDATVPIFPELPPGGYDGKRSHRLAMVFSQFRVGVLGPDKTVDFHSLRRTFATFYEHAQAGGVSEATEIVRKDLMGHDRGDVTSKAYVGRNLGWDLYSRAVDGVVRVGMPRAVQEALEETARKRPPLPGKVSAAPRNRPQRKRRTAA
jgi:integrase